MDVTIVYDNHTGNPDILSGWGFSCLVDGRILFDTGEAPESLLFNLGQLGVSLKQIEAVVISHEHWDHFGGLWEVLKNRPGLPVYICPGFSAGFKDDIKKAGGTPVEAESRTKINDTISVTGEIPAQYKGEPMPEQALILKTPQGISMITGCSHPGILTMVRTVQDIHPDKSVQLVMGGFHLMDTAPRTIQSIVASMKEMDIRSVGPTHCSGEAAQQAFREHFDNQYVTLAAGLTINIP